MDTNSFQQILVNVEEYQQAMGLTYGVDSIKKLEEIIDAVCTDIGEQPGDFFFAIWGIFYGERIVHSFGSKWDGLYENIILWDGDVINPFETVLLYVKERSKDLLVNTYKDIAIKYANSRKYDPALSKEALKTERINTLMNALGLKGLRPVNSAGEIIEINKARNSAKQLISIMETIDENVKEYEEYQELQQLPVTSPEFKAQLEKIKLKVAETGDRDKMYDVAIDYKMGFISDQNKPGEPNYTESLFWLESAAKKGCTDALCTMGYYYSKGVGVEQNSEKAFLFYEKAAKAGDKIGMNNLGCLYLEGKGVEQDFKKAIFWVRNAIEQGCELGMFTMGEIYENGYGVEKDIYKAKEWYQKACDKGNQYACEFLVKNFNP